MINEKINIPELRFPEFIGEWDKKIMKDTCNIVGGGTPDSGNNKFWNGNIQWFTPTEIKMNYVSTSARTLSELGLKKSSARILPKGTILLTSRATIGEVAIALSECTTNQGFQSLIVNQEFNNIFVFNWIKNNKNQFIRRANGSTFLEISKSEIGSIPIIVPTLPEQQKIASFFTAIDQKISQLKHKKTLLEQFKKGVIQKIFSQQIRFRDENGQEFPKWEKKKLGEIANFFKGKKISKSEVSIDGTTECIRYGELYTYYNETIDKVKSKTNINSNELVFSQANDIIIPASGETQIDIATASCVLRSGIALGGDLNIIRTENNGVFLSYYLNNYKKKDIANLAQGISVVHLYSSQLSILEVEIPSLAEQSKIAIFISSIDTKINHTQTQIENAELWKKGLLQKMFV